MFSKLGHGMLSIFNHRATETPLVRMFRTEYHKEFTHAQKYGIAINDHFVNEFLAEQGR